MSRIRLFQLLQLSVALAIVLICSLVLVATPLRATTECDEPPITWSSTPPGSIEVCVGQEVTITAAASDSDLVGGWPACPTTPDSVTVTGQGPMVFPSPGTYQVIVTANDAGSPVEDGEITTTVTVEVVSVTVTISGGGGLVCAGDSTNFTATTSPSGYEDEISWSCTGGSPTSGSGSSFSVTWSSAGSVTASVCGDSDSAGIIWGARCTGTGCCPHSPSSLGPCYDPRMGNPCECPGGVCGN